MEEFDQPLPKIKSAAAANKAKSYDDESGEEDEESMLLEEDESSSEIEEEEETEEQEGNPRSSYRMFPPVNDGEKFYIFGVHGVKQTYLYFAAIYYPDGNRKKTKLFVANF